MLNNSTIKQQIGARLQSLKRGQTGYLVVQDVDSFKKINDTNGHLFGDAVLCSFADELSNIFPEALKGRIGGDEFCVVIYGNDPSDMEELFRQMKQEQDEFNSKNAIPQIQIAYGYAEFDPETDRDIEDTRSRADDKMYQKKREIKADTNENKRTE